jgi:hypothetical protein
MRSRIMVRFGGEDAEDLGPSTRTSSSSRTIGERGWIEEKRDSGHNQKSFFVTLRLEKPWESLPRRGYTTQPGVSTPGTGLGVRFSARIDEQFIAFGRGIGNIGGNLRKALWARSAVQDFGVRR